MSMLSPEETNARAEVKKIIAELKAKLTHFEYYVDYGENYSLYNLGEEFDSIVGQILWEADHRIRELLGGET